MSESEERQRVVNIARSWVGTPYHTGGRVKGRNGGVDCLTVIAEVFAEACLLPKIPIPYYPPDWHLHKSGERYLEGVLKYTHEIEGPPQPGDIALWKFGRCFSHGAVVLSWPQVMHAYVGSSCRFENADTAHWLKFIGENVAERGKPRAVRFFSFWGK
jgi:cell wall-associated NlpC family hydrolase